MKHMLGTLALSALLLGSLATQATPAKVVAQCITASVPDYYEGLGTGTGYRDYAANLYGTGTPDYNQTIHSYYLQASQKRTMALQDNDQATADFWTGFIDGLGWLPGGEEEV